MQFPNDPEHVNLMTMHAMIGCGHEFERFNFNESLLAEPTSQRDGAAPTSHAAHMVDILVSPVTLWLVPILIMSSNR